MIQGIGNDIIEVHRIEKAIQSYGQKFLDRIFTAREQIYCQRHNDSTRHFAGRFAAKEALVKAMGTGLREGISWLDMEIVNDAQGKPYVILSESLQKRFQNPNFLISISHCKEYATAMAIHFQI